MQKTRMSIFGEAHKLGGIILTGFGAKLGVLIILAIIAIVGIVALVVGITIVSQYHLMTALIFAILGAGLVFLLLLTGQKIPTPILLLPVILGIVGWFLEWLGFKIYSLAEPRYIRSTNIFGYTTIGDLTLELSSELFFVILLAVIVVLGIGVWWKYKD